MNDIDTGLPPVFPCLPRRSASAQWSANIRSAHQLLSAVYQNALSVLNQDNSDPLRVAYHIDTITSDAVPLLSALEGEEPGRLPDDWLHPIAEIFGYLLIALQQRREEVQHREDARIEIPAPVTIEQTGKPGRPRKSIDLAFLHEACSSQRRLTNTELASLLGVHRNVLHRYMKQHGIHRPYSTISNDELDTLTKEFKMQKPESGIRYIIGYFRNRGLRIQERRVRASVKRVDRLGCALRVRKVVRRRKYEVKRPNALWHLDGHHKLIKWGIVIHAVIDGYCRTVTGIRASTNNRAITVLELLLDAVEDYGMPSRLRGDRGGENVDCAAFMVLRNGPNRGSFIWGSSTNNTRIERLWVEVGTQFVRRWRGFFTRLERLHGLNVANPVHLWLLHTLFLDLINDDCIKFRDQWNSHPIAGSGNKSPMDLRFIGKLMHGVYVNEHEGVHPATFDHYCRDDTGDDDQALGAGQMLEGIGIDQQTHVRHEGVNVPDNLNPFTDTQSEGDFFAVFSQVVKEEVLPVGYGLYPAEWEDGIYPETETIRVGKRSGKEYQVSLVDPIWKHRAELWVQGLSVLAQFNMFSE